ncbi:hypothetical protein COB52_02440 [Candidatus Kaiserbacteria bacterium]|nr:MAG: hypothetical protein COB52_02440 [Candidatus Kaiserbacteria bacterium]
MQRYVLISLLALSLGIAFRSFYDFGWSFIFLLLTLSLVSFLIKKNKVLFLIVIISFSFGVLRMHTASPSGDVLKSSDSYTGVIVSEPDVRGSYTNLFVLVEEEKVLVRADSYQEFFYHDEVIFKGDLETVENFEGEGGRVFNYRGYLAKSGVSLISPFPEIEIVSSEKTFVGALLSLKKKYLNSIKENIREPYAALAGGITVGEQRSLGEKLTQDFRRTGLIHIVVLSGYNIAIIVMAISAVLIFLPPKWRSGVSILVIVLFTIFVGASSTVVRAAVMGTIGALGVMVGRSYDALHALFIAAFLMLLWNPYLLIFDPSFQLSFVATLGLLVGTPILLPYLEFLPNKFALRELTAASITTQISVLPLLIYMMGEVSVVALIVNLITLPIIPLAMLGVFLTGVVGMFSGALAMVFAYFSEMLLRYVIFIVESFSSLSFATVKIPEISFLYIVVMYLLLWWWVNENRQPF